MRGAVSVTGALAMWLLLVNSAFGDTFWVEYHGELVDQNGRPLAGVFAFTFKLYDDSRTNEPSWTEQHFVAVLEGQYRVWLGGAAPLDQEWRDRQVEIAVELADSELVREPFRLVAVAEPQDQTFDDPLDYLRSVMPTEVTEVTFAQVADRAVYAERANRCRNAELLGGRTVQELDRWNELVEMLVTHQSDPNAHGGARRQQSTGSSTMVLQLAGGPGGTPYTRMCPQGYVMVGLQGGAGTLVDSVQVVCAPLE